jgi:hypothetical protein
MAKTKAQLEAEVAALKVRLEKAEKVYLAHRLFSKDMKTIANGLYAFSGGKIQKGVKKTAAELFVHNKAVKIYDGLKTLDHIIKEVKTA